MYFLYEMLVLRTPLWYALAIMPKIPSVSAERDDASRKGGVYPYGSLSAALKMGEAVYECGGSSGPVPKAIVAQRMKAADSSPTFYQQIATAKCYGILEGKNDLGMTEAAKDYFMPVDDWSRRRAELKFFCSPKAFQYLIKRFDGNKLPDSQVVGNILLREKIAPASWSLRVAQLFLSTAKDLGLHDDNGILRFAAENHSAVTKSDFADLDEESSDSSSVASSVGTSETEGFAPTAKPNPKHFIIPRRNWTAHVPAPQVTTRATNDVWTHPSGMRVEVPADLTPELWDRLNRHVQSLKPTDGSGKEG